MSQLSYGLLSQLIDIPCSSCGYLFEVQLVDVYTQTFRTCPCCRQRFRLVDGDGSVYGTIQDVDQAMRNLQSQMKGLFG